jgi:hypothetical protein
MAIMIRPRLTSVDERIIEPMIDLARCSRLQRIIVVGSTRAELMFELHRRSYVRVATTTNCGLPAGRCDVALVDWRQRSIKSLETALSWLVNFLSRSGVLVIWVDPQEPAVNRKLCSALERHGLVVEAGTVCEHGSAVSARRREVNPISNVA